MNKKIFVSSEIGQLKRVIVHRPDVGINRLTPKRFEELLFDDIVHLEEMQKEHDIFTQVLAAFLGEGNVIEIENVLEQTLAFGDRERMIDKLMVFEELPTSYKKLLLDLDNIKLADALISGAIPDQDLVLFDPIPNFIFTRDIAVTINDHLIVTKAAKEARSRENFITRFIFREHKVFQKMYQEGKLIDLNDLEQFPPSRKGQKVSIEGGDCMIINQDYFLIGRSERTSEHGVNLLKNSLLEKGVVKNVVKVTIPAERSFMHIDTIFTRISEDHLVSYKPIVVDGLSSYVDVFRADGTTAHYPSIKEFFLAEINPNMKFILVGDGESPYQEREQWTDGGNLVALKPGVGITYDRNIVTNKAFEKFGYTVIKAADLLAQFKANTLRPEDVKKTIIVIPSHELSRARGGSHCMTCPIERI